MSIFGACMAEGGQTTFDLALFCIQLSIVKRYSSTALRLLQYIFSFLNASVQKLRERKHFAKSNVDNSSPSSKSREAEAGANAGSTTILCSPDSGHSLNQPAATTDTRSRPADGQGSKQHTPHTRCCQPPLRKSMTLADRLTGLLSMLSVLDHPGFIGRALRATQQSKAKPSHTAQQHHATGQDDQVRDHETDVDKWMVFCDTFQKDIENINLLVGLTQP
ncbi:hypothetical protein EDD16DRAFT_1606431 [Pisolithus croceorrhizus]|nr:hypothetical protein EDD16DRAFT_1606431 [Pisolithus croceorrhizus]KAI6122539.1 hypothetical protein EV401DRAFT_1950451 [Pisolithus croceorrhizus]KAI6139465.1 hypothetical protein EDD17DRAFT_1671669 [Pisolithus thermaeus]